MRQRFAKHIQNLNPKLVKVKNHGHVEPKDLYHERVKISDRFRKQIWRNNRVEMKAQNVANIIPISIVPTPNLLHNNNVGITYVGTSNFRMEPIRFVPFYYVVMPKSIIIIIEAPFITTKGVVIRQVISLDFE